MNPTIDVDMAEVEEEERWTLESAVNEVRRLRHVIRAGGPIFRAERAAMDIPDGLDPADPKVSRDDCTFHGHHETHCVGCCVETYNREYEEITSRANKFPNGWPKPSFVNVEKDDETTTFDLEWYFDDGRFCLGWDSDEGLYAIHTTKKNQIVRQGHLAISLLVEVLEKHQ